MSSETTGSTPGISVIVASKVGSPFINQCLNSLAKEAGALGAEVIVVAAGEPSYAERIAAAFPWTKVIHAADGCGREILGMEGRPQGSDVRAEEGWRTSEIFVRADAIAWSCRDSKYWAG